jgi:pimeloyl-ACP methyl ester carboxylesterase
MNRCEPLPVARELWQAGFHCLVFDFRAMGQERGRFVYDWRFGAAGCAVGGGLRDGALRPICLSVVYGASMGGAAAILAAAEDPRIRAVVADSAYARLNLAVKDWWRNAVGKASILLHPTLLIGRLYTRQPPTRSRPKR